MAGLLKEFGISTPQASPRGGGLLEEFGIAPAAAAAAAPVDDDPLAGRTEPFFVPHPQGGWMLAPDISPQQFEVARKRAWERQISEGLVDPEKTRRENERSFVGGGLAAVGRAIPNMVDTLATAGALAVKDLSENTPGMQLERMRSARTGEKLPANPIGDAAIKAAGALHGSIEESTSIPLLRKSQSAKNGILDKGSLSNPNWWIENGVDVVAQLGTQIALASATGGGTLAFGLTGGAIATGSYYNDAIARGVDEPTARKSAVMVGAATAALDKIGAAASLFRKNPAARSLIEQKISTIIGDRAAKGFVSGTVEEATEIAQEAFAIGTQYFTEGKDPAVLSGAANRLVTAGVLGRIGGTVAGVATGGIKSTEQITSSRDSALTWIIQNGEAASGLLAKDNPSRSDFAAAGLPGRTTAEQRTEFVAKIRGVVDELKAKSNEKLNAEQGGTQAAVQQPWTNETRQQAGGQPKATTETEAWANDKLAFPEAEAAFNEQQAADATKKTDATIASVPVMITGKMRQFLRGVGYSDADIRNMTPEQAHQAINSSAPQSPPGIKLPPAESVVDQDTNALAMQADSQSQPQPERPPVLRGKNFSDADTDAMAAATAPVTGAVRSGGNTPPIPVKFSEPDVKGEQVSQHDIIATMARDFNVPIKSGHLRGKSRGLLGRFHRKWKNVRVMGHAAGDLAVHTHEVAHSISDRTGIRKKLPLALKAELAPLDYDKTQQRPEEGWAEFLRMYLTNPDQAKRLAPKFHDYFENQWMPANPDDQAKIQRTKKLITQWREQGAGERIKSAISFDGKGRKPLETTIGQMVKDRATAAVHATYEALKDEGHFLNLFTKDAKSRGHVSDVGDDPYSIYKAFAQNGPTFANTAIESGVFTLTGKMERIGPSLTEVFEGINPAEYEDFVSWMVARHARESWERGQNPGIAREDADHWFQQHQDKAHWEKAADKLKDFNDSLIEMLADAGVIGAPTAEVILESWKTYVPLLRVQEGALSGMASRLGGRKFLNLSNPLKGRKGSGLQVLDPIMGTVERAVRFYERAAQQQVIESVVNVANKTPGMVRRTADEPQSWIEEIPPALRQTAFSAAEVWPQIGRKLADLGVIPDDMIKQLTPFLAEDMMSIWRPDFNYMGKEPIARVMRGGEPKLYQFDPEFFRAINGMNHFQLPFFVDITFGKATRAVKLGAVGLSLAFGVRNPIRDYGTWLFQKRHTADSAKGLVKPAEMLGAYVYSQYKSLVGDKGNPVVKLFQEMGGELGMSLGLDRRIMRRKITDLVADSTQRRALNIVKHPVDLLRSMIGVTEVGPRLAEFASALEKHGYSKERLASGELPPRNVLIEAVNAAHDVTVNFKRTGYVGKWLNQIYPFWNAQTEGVDKFVRTWKDNPKRTFILAATAAAATVAYWFSKKDEDWRKEAPPWLKYGFWTITDSNGKPVWRVPRPYEWGWTVSAGTEAMLDAINEKDPGQIAEWGKQAAGATLPWDPAEPVGSFMPALLKPAYEVASNEDTFTHRPIVDDRRKDLLPEDQHTPFNTELSKAFGKYLGVSPAKLEHLLEGYSGGLFGRTVRPVESALAGKPTQEGDAPVAGAFQFKKDYSRSVEEFYSNLKTAEREYNSGKFNGEVSPEVAKRFATLDEYSGVMSDLRKAIDFTADRDERFQVERYVVGLARYAMGHDELERYPNPLKAKSDSLPEPVKVAVDDYVGRLRKRLRGGWPVRAEGEPVGKYQERRQKHRLLVERSQAVLQGLEN